MLLKCALVDAMLSAFVSALPTFVDRDVRLISETKDVHIFIFVAMLRQIAQSASGLESRWE
jgi:hypothetical protein